MAASKQRTASKQQPCAVPDSRDLYLPPLLPAEGQENSIFHVKLKAGLLATLIDNAMTSDIGQDIFHVKFETTKDGRMEIKGDNYEFSKQPRPEGNNAQMSSMYAYKENIHVAGMVESTLQVDLRPSKNKTPKSVPRRRAPRSPTTVAKRPAKELNDTSSTAAKPGAPKRQRMSADAAHNPLRPAGAPPSSLSGLRSTPSPHLSPGGVRPSSLTHGFSKSRSMTPPGAIMPRNGMNGSERVHPSPGLSPAQSSVPSSPGVGNLRPRFENGKELRTNIIHILALGEVTEAKLRARLFDGGPDRESENVLRKTLNEVAMLGKSGYVLLDDKWREVSDSFDAYSQLERSRVRKSIAERNERAAAKKKTPLRSRLPAKPVPKSEPRLPKSEPRAPKPEPRVPKSEPRVPKSEPRVPKSEPRGKADVRVPKSEPRKSLVKGILPEISRDSSDQEMQVALDAFDNRLRKTGPIRSESEDEEVRKYWPLLHALYSEVNRRLETVQSEMEELGNSFEKADGGSIKKELERQIGIMYKKHVGMHKEYVRYLPKLHKEVKRTLERLEEWVENRGESS